MNHNETEAFSGTRYAWTYAQLKRQNKNLSKINIYMSEGFLEPDICGYTGHGVWEQVRAGHWSHIYGSKQLQNEAHRD